MLHRDVAAAEAAGGPAVQACETLPGGLLSSPWLLADFQIDGEFDVIAQRR